ncbi:DUF5996 family protein [Steroidobacter gossypii]
MRACWHFPQCAAAPEQALREFLQSTYQAAARLGGWGSKAPERESVQQ